MLSVVPGVVSSSTESATACTMRKPNPRCGRLCGCDERSAIDDLDVERVVAVDKRDDPNLARWAVAIRVFDRIRQCLAYRGNDVEADRFRNAHRIEKIRERAAHRRCRGGLGDALERKPAVPDHDASSKWRRASSRLEKTSKTSWRPA